MSDTSSDCRRRRASKILWGFPLLYLGWAYAFWSPIFGSGESVWSFPNVVFFLVGGASPLLAGVVLAAWTGGRGQLRDLWRRLTDVRRITVPWWLIILSFWLVFNLVMAGAAVVMGITDRPLDVAWNLFIEPGNLAFLLVLSFVFPAVEEVGLRGVYLDALQERFSAAVSGLLNGGLWAAWHAPFVWLPGYYAHTNFNPALSWWFPMIVLTTLLIVHVYNYTQRSILAVLMFHGMMNFTGELLRISAGMYPFVLSGYALAAIAVIVFWQRQGS